MRCSASLSVGLPVCVTMAAVCSISAIPASSQLALDKNSMKSAAGSSTLRSVCLVRALHLGPTSKVGRRNALISSYIQKGWNAEKLMSLKSGSRRSIGGGSVRAEVYIENADGEVHTADEVKSIPGSQTAWIYQEYGPKEVLSTAEVVVPKPASDQVLVEVYAAALNVVDFKRRSGKFKASDSDLPTVPGYDVAGVVVEVGSDVTKFKVGDRVYGDVSEHCLNGPKQYGSLAHYCAVEEKLIAAIPERLSFAEAASLPLAVETAYQAFELAELKEGQTVLVLGGAGGVGSLAIQLAKHVFKASLVAATTSTSKVDFVKSLGADVVIDYKNESLAEHPQKYDVVVDTVGKGEAVQVVTEGGRAAVLTGPVEPPGFRFVVTSRGANLETLNPFLQDGIIKPIVDTQGPFKFSDVVDAFAYLESGRATGKVVISPIAE